MTREHVPPRTVGNDQPVGRVDEQFDHKAVVRAVAEWQEGHVVRTLCNPCNHQASAWGYVAEYRRWHDLFLGRARQLAAERGTDPLRGSGSFPIELPYDLQPGRFVRQVIGMFLAVQATEHLLASYPFLADLVGADPDDGDRRRQAGLSIHPLYLRLSVCNTDWCYLTQPGMSAEIPLGSSGGLWTPPGSRAKTHDTLLLVLAPFAFALTSSDSADIGVDVTEWATLGVDDRARRTQRGLSIPTADHLPGWARALIYPADTTRRRSAGSSTRPTPSGASTPGCAAPPGPDATSPPSRPPGKCLYLAVRSLDPTGAGATRWLNRWKPALNAFAITRLFPTDQ